MNRQLEHKVELEAYPFRFIKRKVCAMSLSYSRTHFFRKTRKGGIVKSVNENYSHNDFLLGFLRGERVTSDVLQQIIENSSLQKVIVVDTNVLLHHMDILEDSTTELDCVVVCQTALCELRNLNLSVYKRAVQLLKDETRHYLFYPNVCVDNSLQRIRDESSNDFNDRSIVHCCKIFSDAFQGASTVLITNDRGNQERAKSEGVTAESMEGFLRKHCQPESQLLDKLMLSSSLAPRTTENYFSYLPKNDIEAGIRSGTYYRGYLNSRTSSWDSCYIIVNDQGNRKSILVEGAQNVNRAIVGDLVAVEVTQGNIVPDVDAEGVVDYRLIEALSSDAEGSSSQMHGKVVGVLKRNMKRYFGSVDPSTIIVDESDGGCLVEFVSVDKNTPRILIRVKSIEEVSRKRLAVVIDSWPIDSQFPLGHIVSFLGDIGDKEVETDIILNELGITRKEFSTAVMACLPPDDWVITEECLKGRLDLRSLPIASVDPPGCKDIDDALHCVRLPNGRWQVGVHIADVTHFVKPGSALDKEAAERSTSTYLVDRRLDMLPSLLTTELCSLRSSEEHLAFSVLWEMDDEANIIDVQFGKSVIDSKASLTYDQAQVIIDTHNEVESSLQTSIKNLNKLAKILKKRRLEAGALTLASPEVRFKLDAETQDPTDLSLYNIKESNSMVEEWMLLANITVSKKILKHFPTLGVLRRHQPPSRDQFVPLLLSARVAGFELDITNSRTLADSLDLAVREDDSMFNKLLRMLATRCMMPAQYFCSGEISKDQWHHYGLATQVYTHFTSPIRRYADVVVHRLLAASLGIEQLPNEYTDRKQMQELCSHMNKRHRAAQHAQRASVAIYSVAYFRNNPIVEDAYIMEIHDDTVKVMVPKFGIESAVSYDALAKSFGADVATVNPERNRLDFTGTNSTVSSISLLQKVSVRVVVEDISYGLGKVVLQCI